VIFVVESWNRGIGDRQIAKSPNRQIAKSPNPQIHKSPNHQINHSLQPSPEASVGEAFTNHSITQSHNH
jgi:hypothetical protein